MSTKLAIEHFRLQKRQRECEDVLQAVLDGQVYLLKAVQELQEICKRLEEYAIEANFEERSERSGSEISGTEDRVQLECEQHDYDGHSE